MPDRELPGLAAYGVICAMQVKGDYHAEARRHNRKHDRLLAAGAFERLHHDSEGHRELRRGGDGVSEVAAARSRAGTTTPRDPAWFEPGIRPPIRPPKAAAETASQEAAESTRPDANESSGAIALMRAMMVIAGLFAAMLLYLYAFGAL